MGSPNRASDKQYTGFWDTGAGKKASGQNPYAGIQGQVQGYRGQVMPWAGQAFNQAMARPPGMGGGVGGGGAGWSEGGFPPPFDPTVASYQSQIQGQQQNMLNDYVKQAYARNLRGGRVAGGADPQAAMHSQAMDQLQRGQAQRYDQAMGYAKDAANYRYNAYNDQANRAAGLAGQMAGYGLQSFNPQLQAAQGESAQNQALWNAQRQDYRGDIDYNRGGRDRDWEDYQRQQQRQRNAYDESWRYRVGQHQDLLKRGINSKYDFWKMARDRNALLAGQEFGTSPRDRNFR
jgi:hypothetical protein